MSILLGDHWDLIAIERKGLRMLLALKALLYTYCPAILTIGTVVGECNWAGRGAGCETVAKQALPMSLVVMLHILKPDQQLTRKFAKTTAVALLFRSCFRICPP